MLSPNELKEMRKQAEELQHEADDLFSDERRATYHSMMFEGARETIDRLLDDLSERQQIHREEQIRSADRLKIAVDMLKKIATPVYVAQTEEAALIQIEHEAMAIEALDEIKKVGVDNAS